MTRKKILISTLVVAGCALYAIMRCAAPLDPSLVNTNVDMILQSPTLIQDGAFFEDSLGTPIRIGIVCFLPENIDSIQLQVTTPTGQVITDTMLDTKNLFLRDTIWDTLTFLQAGSKNIIVRSFSSVEIPPVIAELLIHHRELPGNQPPLISVKGNRIIRPKETCTLTVRLTDADSSQIAAIKLSDPAGGGLLIGDSLFVWTAPEDFSGADTFIIISTDNGIPPASDTDTLIITVTRNPHAPSLTIEGDRTPAPGSTCVFTINQSDEDSGQTVRTTVSGNPEGSLIVDGNVFMWEIPGSHAGRDTLFFTATDNGEPPQSTIDTVIVIITAEGTNYAPAWTRDTIAATITDAESVDINLPDFCRDPDGDKIIFSLTAAAPDNDTIDSLHYRYAPAAGTNTDFYAAVTATDKKGASSTCALKITVRPLIVDKTPPVLAMVDPAKDSASVNSSVVAVTISAVDAGGIDSVVCSTAAGTFAVKRTDALFTAVVSGLVQDKYNRIVFTATDGSKEKNTNSIIFHLKFDPSMEDHSRPIVRRITPDRDSATVATASTTVSIVAVDVSGIGSVACSAGERQFEVTKTDSVYSAVVTGFVHNRFTRILFNVTDASAGNNRDSVVLYINYDSTVNDHTPPVLTRISPERDSSTIGSASFSAAVSAIDENGIEWVHCFVNGNSCALSNTASTYSAAIAQLIPNRYNRISFVAVDGSTAGNRDSIVVYVYYDPTLNDRTPPVFTRLSPGYENGTVGTPSVEISFSAGDESGIRSLTGTLEGTPIEVTNNGSIYTAVVNGLAENRSSRIVFTATDNSAAGNRDSILFYINYDPTMSDMVPPSLTRSVPETDSGRVGTSSLRVSVAVVDISGLGPVTCLVGSASFPVTRNGPIYSAVITGLLPGQYNTIAFIAVDASSNANRDTIYFYINYDPTMNDHTPPALSHVAPAADSSIVGSSATRLTVSITDANGIDSVRCTVGGSPVAVAGSGGNNYSADITGLPANMYSTIVFVAIDASFNANRDSIRCYVKYDPTLSDNTPPALSRITPAVDSSIVNSSTMRIVVSATDVNRIGSVKCTMDGTIFAVSADGSNYSANVAGLTVNQYKHIVFTAVDGSANANRDSIAFHIKYDPTIDDNTPPVLNRITPVTESSIRTTSSLTVTVSVADPGGIGSVRCTMGNNSYTVTNNGANYSADITALVVNVYNRIVFTAVDASSNRNSDSLVFLVKYDPTLNDLTPPVLTRTGWPASGSRVATSPLTLPFSVADANGIDSVWWTMNGIFQARLSPTPAGSNNYTFPATLSHALSNRIVVKATDNASNHNRDSVVLILGYNRPPTATSQLTLSTPRGVAKQITLQASDLDGDGFTQWKIIAGPFIGTISSRTTQTFTYTPTRTYEGRDSLTFRVWDAFDSSLVAGSIKITMTRNDTTPAFVREPVSMTGNYGTPVTFTSSINTAYPAPVYRWVKGTDTVNTSGPGFTIPSLAYGDAGSYLLVVRNRAGSVTSSPFTLTVNDITPPVLTLIGSDDTTIALGGSWVDPGAKAVDDRDGIITSTIRTTGTVTVGTVGAYRIQYDVTDLAGNAAASIVRRVRVEGWERVTSLIAMDYTTVMTRDNRYFILYRGSNESVRAATILNGDLTQVGTETSGVISFTMALSNDLTTPYIAYLTANGNEVNCVVKRLELNQWVTVFDKPIPVASDYRNFLNLALSPDNTPHVALSFQNGNDLSCGVFKPGLDRWVNINTNSPAAFNSSFSPYLPGRDKNVLCFSGNIPYLGANVANNPACKKLVDYRWSPAAADSFVNQSDASPKNIHVLRSSLNQIYFGYTVPVPGSLMLSKPTVYRLDGLVWTELPSMAVEPAREGGGTSMAFSGNDVLYAVHHETAEFIVRTWDGLRWKNVPDVGTAVAFLDNCTGVSIAPGSDECYVTYIRPEATGARYVFIRHWKRQ